MPDDPVTKRLDSVALPGLPRAFAELHHADAKTPSDRPQEQPKRRRRLAFALARVNDQEALFRRLCRHLGVLSRLPLLHFGFVAGLVFAV